MPRTWYKGLQFRTPLIYYFAQGIDGQVFVVNVQVIGEVGPQGIEELIVGRALAGKAEGLRLVRVSLR